MTFNLVLLLAGLISIALSLIGLFSKPVSTGIKAQFAFGIVLVIAYFLLGGR